MGVYWDLGADELKISEFCSEFLSFSNYFCGFWRLKLCCCYQKSKSFTPSDSSRFPADFERKIMHGGLLGADELKISEFGSEFLCWLSADYKLMYFDNFVV